MPPSGSSTPQSQKLRDEYVDIPKPITTPVEINLPVIPKRDIPKDDDDDSKTDVTLNDPLEDYAYSNNQFDLYNFNSVTQLDNFIELTGYMRGSRITVMYFQKQSNSGDTRTDIADSPTMRNVSTRVYMRIMNYEITLTGPFEYNWDSEQNQAEIKGSAILYPGLIPQLGDRFITNIDTGECAVFTIQNVSQSSYQASNSTYRIDFTIFSHVDQEEIQTLMASTYTTRYFSKKNYLGQGFALLEEDAYRDTKVLKNYRGILANYYYQKFFDPNLQSYVLGHGGRQVYDPFIVEFINRIIPFEVLPYKGIQLTQHCSEIYKKSIWSILLQNNLNCIVGVRPYAYYERLRPYVYSPYITGLLGHEYIMLSEKPLPLHDPCEDTYVFSKAFYDNRLRYHSHHHSFEELLYQFISRREFKNSRMFIEEYLDRFDKLSEYDQFYRIPIYFWMINIVIRSLSRVTV